MASRMRVRPTSHANNESGRSTLYGLRISLRAGTRTLEERR
jgi:hypothetical protein